MKTLLFNFVCIFLFIISCTKSNDNITPYKTATFEGEIDGIKVKIEEKIDNYSIFSESSYYGGEKYTHRTTLGNTKVGFVIGLRDSFTKEESKTNFQSALVQKLSKGDSSIYFGMYAPGLTVRTFFHESSYYYYDVQLTNVEKEIISSTESKIWLNVKIDVMLEDYMYKDKFKRAKGILKIYFKSS